MQSFFSKLFGNITPMEAPCTRGITVKWVCKSPSACDPKISSGRLTKLETDPTTGYVCSEIPQIECCYY